MGVYTIWTDSHSMNEIEAPTPHAAVREFLDGESGVPTWVRGVRTLERWLERVGGYGWMEDETTGEILFRIDS